jgi:hypothetical protein
MAISPVKTVARRNPLFKQAGGKARVKPTSLSFTAAFDGAVEEQQARFAAFAKAENAKIMAEEPRPTAFRRWVDGHEGAPEETVRPDGVIRYRYHRIDAVVDFALQTLRELSPVLSGAYRAAHKVFVDNVEVASLETWTPGKEVVIANIVPYTRKIEQGSMKMRVPGSDHVYEQARLIVMRRMSNIAKITFDYRSVRAPGAAVGKIVRTKKGIRVQTGGRLRTVEDAQSFPALIIEAR